MPRVELTKLIPVETSRVWELVRDFNGLPDWHPMVATSHIEAGLSGTSVGCVRNFQLHDGATLREQLLALSDVDRSCAYNILESPLPVRNYRAELRFWTVTGRTATLAQWHTVFDVPPEQETETVDLVQNIFAEGLKGLEQAFREST